MYQDRVVWGYGSSDMTETWSHADSFADAVEQALSLADDLEAEWAYVCAGQYPDPGAVLASMVDMGELLERMDEYANDNEIYSGDDELFAPLGDAVAARAALEDALRQWAREWVTVSVWTATGVAVAIRNLTAGPVLHSGGAETAPSARPAEAVCLGQRGEAEAPGDPGRARP